MKRKILTDQLLHEKSWLCEKCNSRSRVFTFIVYMYIVYMYTCTRIWCNFVFKESNFISLFVFSLIKALLWTWTHNLSTRCVGVNGVSLFTLHLLFLSLLYRHTIHGKNCELRSMKFFFWHKWAKTKNCSEHTLCRSSWDSFRLSALEKCAFFMYM